MRSTPSFLLLLTACTGGNDNADLSRGGPGDPGPAVLADGTVVFRPADDLPPLRGSGGPAVTFAENQLFENCAFLTGDEADFDHHNLVVPYRGHLVMPWAPEFGLHGGVTLFDMADPCNPVKVGEGISKTMRETHAMGFVHLPEDDPHAGDWAVGNGLVGLEAGIQFWDLADASAPTAISNLALPGSIYPDSYTTVTLAVFWQYPWVYAASADNGVFVVDATDPYAPRIVSHYVFEQGLRAGGVFAMGDVLLVTSAEGEQAALLDVSDPADPQLFPGSPFDTLDGDGVPRESYHGNRVGQWALFARKEAGGGPIVYDISDPAAPVFVADLPLPGSGGYVFYDEGYLFTGDSSLGHVIDARDWTDLKVVTETYLTGDLDTVTPYGNVAIVSVDDLQDGRNGESSAVVPYLADPDTTPPIVLHVEPRDGATGVPLTARIGIGLNEFVEPSSVFAGSVRLWDGDGNPVDGWGSATEATASFVPKAPLEPGNTYTLEVLADGLCDLDGNTLAEPVTTSFTTVE